jgi:hypothetical protein
MSAQLPICFSPGERPLDAASSGVTPPLPSRYRGGESGLLGSTARQALALQNSDLDLSHVQPTRMVRRVVELDPAQDRRGRLDTEHFLETLAPVR